MDSVLDQKFSKSKKFFKREIFFHNISIKHDILRLFAKKNFGEHFLSPTLSWTLSQTKNFLSPKFFKREIFFQNFSIKHDILRLIAKKNLVKIFSKCNFVLDPILDSVLDQKFSKSKMFLKGNFFHNISIKHDILRLFAKKKVGEHFLSPTLSWTLSQTKNFLSPNFLKGKFFFIISPSSMTL